MRIKIASVGEAVLRRAARPLSNEEIGSARIRDLIAHMRETLSDAPGVGLAAPQVGESLQLAIIEDKAEYQKIFTAAELSERGREPVPFHVLINPEIELLTASDVTFFEGCLSLPGFVGMVPRARKVRVKALNEIGEPIHIDAEGWYARSLVDMRRLVKDLTARGVTVEFVKEGLRFTGDDSPMAILLLSLLGAVAEFERSLILERQREGIVLAKAAGKYKGRRRILNAVQIHELRGRAADGERKTALAREFGVSRETLYCYLRAA
jgi:peptide deformylase